jgi:PhnB protein
MAVKPIPDGYHSITPYLIVSSATRMIEFLKAAFDAREIHRTLRPDGGVMHAEVRVGDSPLMLSEAWGEHKAMPACFYLYVPDADAAYQQALKAGATSIMAPMDQFYGDRHGGVLDPVGNQWWVATHIEDVSSEELQRRSDAFMKQRTQS